jgi:hypothetical protein
MYTYMKDTNILQARIAKAIKENTCPYTTEADIRYFEKEEYRAELSAQLAQLCDCGEPLTQEHYAHMAKGY